MSMSMSMSLSMMAVILLPSHLVLDALSRSLSLSGVIDFSRLARSEGKGKAWVHVCVVCHVGCPVMHSFT